jgi:hypothetical protein
LRGVADRRGILAVRVLLALAFFVPLSGCEQILLPPEEGVERAEVDRARPGPRLAPQPAPEPVVEEPPFDSTDELVGDFCRPEDVPDHRVASAEGAGNDLMPVLELVVDTRATSEMDLTFISRDLKASYASHDALLVSFVDTARPGEPETGEAQIINAVDGALILGIPEGPPNREGLTVISYTDPATVDDREVFARTAC